MSLSNAFFLKRFKRRPLVMVSGIGMAICMFISGTFTKWIKEGMLTEPLFLYKSFWCKRPCHISFQKKLSLDFEKAYFRIRFLCGKAFHAVPS